MSLKKIYAVFIRQWFLIKSNPTRLAGMFLWLVIDIIQWGFISRYLGTFGNATFNIVSVLLGAIILWEFMTRVQQGLMTGFLEDIWSQNFINFFASPLEIKEYIGGLVLNGIASSVTGFIMLSFIAGIFFGYNVFKIGILILPFLFLLLLFGMAIGIFISAIIFRFGPTAEWLGWPIPFALSIFSGVYYPISTLPQGLQIIARFIPASYVFESMRSILSRGAAASNLGSNFIAGFALALVYLFITYSFFIRVYKHNMKNGNIARFSAEQ